MSIQKVNIIGMGALGMLFGSLMEEDPKVKLSYVMDPERLARHKRDTYTINGEEFRPAMISPKEAAKEPADLVLLAVKYPALSRALETMETSVGENTTLLSVMNGIDSETILSRRFGEEKVLYAIAQGMDAQRYGTDLKFSVRGQLNIGVPKNSPCRDILRERLADVCQFFDEEGIKYVVEEDILYRIWSKFMLNVGINQVCMVYDATFGEAMQPGSEEYAMVIAAMREVCLIAQAKDIPIGEKDVREYMDILKTLSPMARPSMGQDRRQKNKSEVDMFAGVINRMGRELGIATPVNEYLEKRVREIEKNYD